jgi:hypothetical protein
MMMGTVSLRGIALGALCLGQLVAGLNGEFRTSLTLRDFKEQVSNHTL